jgi:hypothetical protein
LARDTGATPPLDVLGGDTPEHGGSAKSSDLLVSVESGQEFLVDSDLYRLHVDSMCWSMTMVKAPALRHQGSRIWPLRLT